MKLITAPTEEPVTLAEAALQCKVDGTEDNALITSLIVAARQQAEHITGRALITQTWDLALDAFPAAEIALKKLPVQSITSVKYLDSTGTEQTIDSANYTLDIYDSTAHWLIPAVNYDWPVTYDAANAVKIQFVTGYGAAAAVPDSIKIWIKLAVNTMYNQRDALIDSRFGEVPRDFFAALLDPYWIPRL